MTQEIKTFFMPFLRENGVSVSLGFLDKEPGSASLSPMPKSRKSRTYTDGDVMQTDTYALSVRFPYSVAGVPECVETFFAELSAFIRYCNQESLFPAFPKGEIPVSISCDLPDKADTISANSCVFTASIHFTYYKMHQKGSIS